jgi:hypothetical protein
MSTVATGVLPKVIWTPTQAKGSRHGAKVQRVVIHRWGVKYVSKAKTAAAYKGVISEFLDKKNEASSHFVFPGCAVPNEITQMVRYSDYAWTQSAYNPTSMEIECADAMWLGHDDEGFEQCAHIVGFWLKHFKLPPVWSVDHGFCRHYDLGAKGGGHSDPTTNLRLWKEFVGLVQTEYKQGGYRTSWGR